MEKTGFGGGSPAILRPSLKRNSALSTEGCSRKRVIGRIRLLERQKKHKGKKQRVITWDNKLQRSLLPTRQGLKTEGIKKKVDWDVPYPTHNAAYS